MINYQALKQHTFCRFREFLREPSAVLFVIIMPPIWIGLLGNIFSSEALTKYRIGLTNDSDKEIVSLLQSDPMIEIEHGELNSLLNAVAEKNMPLVVEIKNRQATYHMNTANNDAARAKFYIDDKIQKFYNRTNPVTTTIKPTPTTIRYIDFFVPGLLAFSIMTSSFFGVGMMIVSHRRENLLKRFLVTPLKPIDYVLSWIFGRLFVLTIETLVIIISGILFFRFQIKGGIFDFIIFAMLGATAFSAISTAMCSFGRNVSTYYTVINIITLPLALFSGIWFETSLLPNWLA
ncbi:MAG: ABC transporter permease, partial [Pseudomonadota bacterium]|nr:ABC transporter permease [Pseudomonadota bacterium]